MAPKKMHFFYLPLNREVICALLLTVILVSYSLIALDTSKQEQAVFRQQPKAYYQGATDKRQIALAVNVAWGTEYIPKILDILANQDAVGTFFLVGNWVEKFPELVVEIEEAGHELGNHGYRHQHPKELSTEKLISLIKKNETLIEGTVDYKTKLFAPPYGEVDQRVVKTAAKIGYKTVMWTIDTIDWQRPAPKVIVDRVVPKLEAGAIILMHPTKPTVKALTEIVTEIKDEGYELVTVTELLSE